VNSANRFIVTKNGYVGSALANTSVGDNVYVLAGGNKAYVLRSKSEAEQQPAFTLVGSCYLHGIIHGEAVWAQRTTKAAMQRCIGKLLRKDNKRQVTQSFGPFLEVYLY